MNQTGHRRHQNQHTTEREKAVTRPSQKRAITEMQQRREKNAGDIDSLRERDDQGPVVERRSTNKEQMTTVREQEEEVQAGEGRQQIQERITSLREQ